MPEELEGLDALLSETYFCNFSLFQSMPDSWAIKQLFPIMPIHRLNERPTHHAVLGRHHLRFGRQDRAVHRPPRREADAAVARLHRASPITWALSCWGPTRKSSATCTTSSATPTPFTSVLGTNDDVIVEAVIKGDTVREVLEYVEFDPNALVVQLADVGGAGGPREPHR